MEQPLISVVMASFNEPSEMIGTSIKSILDQTYRNLELLILDDSTKEETRRAIDDLQKEDSRVRVFRSPERIGFIKSLNKGLEKANGQFIARMDGDDISFPNRFEVEASYLNSHPDVMVVGGQINIINEEGEVTSSRSYPLSGAKLWLFSCARNPLAHPTIMMRREIIDKGYRYDDSLRMSEDLDFWLRLLNDGYKIANVPETVLNYRVMGNFLEKRSSDVQREVMAQVRKKNFAGRHLCHSLLSCAAGWLFTHVPKGAIDKAYQNENKQ